MGYDGLFLGRIDFQDKNKRLTDRQMEMILKASDSLGSKADLFTGILYNTYSPPSGFCFDILCNDEPIIDDENSPEFNADKKVSNKAQAAFTDFICITYRLFSTHEPESDDVLI